MPDTRTAPPSTCKLIGCPGWGRHQPHGIGVPDDFTPYQPTTCLGIPIVTSPFGFLTVGCSISAEGWSMDIVGPMVTPGDMAKFVDLHKQQCLNRSPR